MLESDQLDRVPTVHHVLAGLGEWGPEGERYEVGADGLRLDELDVCLEMELVAHDAREDFDGGFVWNAGVDRAAVYRQHRHGHRRAESEVGIRSIRVAADLGVY
jgi:hypothetical protein